MRGKRARLRPALEPLESRQLLAGDPWLWFQSFDEVPRLSPAELAAPQRDDAAAIGPHDLVASEWLVQLRDVATQSIRSLAEIGGMLDRSPVGFEVISGLGSPGWVLLRGRGVTEDDVRTVLMGSQEIAGYHSNVLVEGQLVPNDDEFQAGRLDGLSAINAPLAWDQFAAETSVGSTSVVVGVVDGGIDVTHPDLFLNVWLNQGEIPDSFRSQLTDLDGDQLITFYDLNNLRHTQAGIVVATTGVPATSQQLIGETPYATGPNAGYVRDINGNGRIDALDLLEDVTWADGFDTDNNSFFDDFFGVNFRSGVGDPFASNRPIDGLGHGTHVAGTIGAIGNNGYGVVGVNWQTSLMSLRILDNNNQSDSAAAVRAINYARQMRRDLQFDESGRTKSGADVRVLNNSWGQPEGFDRALEEAIDQAGDAEILFVAAAGNGNLLGQGVDNDITPFYPASYDLDNVIAVAALATATGELAPFSNYGTSSVDLAAPGVGVLSTAVGGGFRSANGTSMATPHVSGSAALIFAALPGASVAEVKDALLSTTTPMTAGRSLNVGAAINADLFAPSGQLNFKPVLTTSGTSETEFTVHYSHRSRIDSGSLGDDDLIVTRSWGPSGPFPVRLKAGSIQPTAAGVEATYLLDAPGSGSFSSDLAIPIDTSAPNTVHSQILVEGISESSGNMTLSLDIDHDFVDQLTATLIAPNGSRSLLFSNIGGGPRQLHRHGF